MEANSLRLVANNIKKYKQIAVFLIGGYMTSLILDIGLLVGVFGYGAYLVSLLIQGRGRVFGEINTTPAPIAHALGWAAFSSVGGSKKYLAFQRVGRRV